MAVTPTATTCSGGPPTADVTALTPFLWAASAIASTAPDVAAFYRALLPSRLLRPRLLREMETTVAQGSQVDIPGHREGLGLQRFPTACGAAWGSQRDAVLTLNEDASSLPERVPPLLFRLLTRASYTTARARGRELGRMMLAIFAGSAAAVAFGVSTLSSARSSRSSAQPRRSVGLR